MSKKETDVTIELTINLEEAVIRKIKTAQHILCTVESCTGGLISHLLTNVSGASEVYWGSFITYDNSAKEMLGVSSQLISQCGAVSMEIAQALAESGLKKMQEWIVHKDKHTDKPGEEPNESYSLLKPKGYACIATTGIAGPSGGTKDKPVGLCWIGLAISDKKTIVEEFHAKLGQERIHNKIQFAQKALEMIRGHI